MMSRFYVFILLALSITLFSCGSDDEIPADLQIYLDRFEEEANKRNLTYATEVEETKILLVEIINGGVLGQCVRSEEESNQIHVDRSYWEEDTTSDLEKEFVVFHELGHCILNRDHINNPDSDGVCLSIMYNGNSSACNLVYTEANREELIDELFQ